VVGERGEALPEAYVVHNVDGGTVEIAAPPLHRAELLEYAVVATLEWQQRDVFTISYPDWGEGVALTVDTAASEMTLDFWGERSQIEPWSGNFHPALGFVSAHGGRPRSRRL
jgi:hypothetical protein